MVKITLYARQKETQMYRTDFWTLWEKARVGWSERTASTHVYYQVWNRSPVQVGCMRQVLGAGALRWSRGMGWGGRWEGGSGWGAHVNPWVIHVNVWQRPLQYCKVISLQLIKINGEKKKNLSAMQMWIQSLGQEDPLEREWQPTPVFLPEEFHEQRRPSGPLYVGHKESNMIEWLTLSLSFPALDRLMGEKEANFHYNWNSDDLYTKQEQRLEQNLI